MKLYSWPRARASVRRRKAGGSRGPSPAPKGLCYDQRGRESTSRAHPRLVPGAPPPVSRRTALLGALVLALAVFAVDQGLKRLVEGSMRLGESIPLIDGVLHLTFIKNPGGAFGILGGQAGILLLGSAVAVAFVLWMLLAGEPTRATTAGCGLILGGAAGNLVDRILEGEVTDYVDLRVWPIFNAADVAIVLGVGLLLLAALRPEGDAKPSKEAAP
ncbi:signal peptidase II [Rubrobacter marinus]|uniref:Lipoprotein signal peptidase n=1 Tax=Rubrobacter marinus TaxID=2653852 RepID=A0A6G8Q006_9ACTN|nr:signal peptidase II [Rubrobacter marinus]